jgi:hypothetical protein
MFLRMIRSVWTVPRQKAFCRATGFFSAQTSVCVTLEKSNDIQGFYVDRQNVVFTESCQMTSNVTHSGRQGSSLYRLQLVRLSAETETERHVFLVYKYSRHAGS